MNVFLLVILLAIPLIARPQYTTEGLDLDQDVSTWFDQQLGQEKTQIVLGDYQNIQMSPGSHPFYLDKFWIEGSVKYRGEVFHGIKMRYDALGDYLIISHPTDLTIADQPIKLNQSDVSWFTLREARFENYQNLESNQGIYQVLYDGSQIDFVAKRIKVEYVERRSDPLGYKSADNLYVINDRKLFLIKSKASFSKLYPQLKKQIKKFSSDYALPVSRRSERFLSDLAEFCNGKLQES